MPSRPSRWTTCGASSRPTSSGFGVGVTVVQPGLIRTEFASTAAGEIDTADGPYAEFNATVGRATQDAYTKGPLARFGGSPEDVAAAVEAAIDARKAPIRVRVTASARILVAQRQLLSDAMWDRLLRTQFPTPKAG